MLGVFRLIHTRKKLTQATFGWFSAEWASGHNGRNWKVRAIFWCSRGHSCCSCSRTAMIWCSKQHDTFLDCSLPFQVHKLYLTSDFFLSTNIVFALGNLQLHTNNEQTHITTLFFSNVKLLHIKLNCFDVSLYCHFPFNEQTIEDFDQNCLHFNYPLVVLDYTFFFCYAYLNYTVCSWLFAAD